MCICWATICILRSQRRLHVLVVTEEAVVVVVMVVDVVVVVYMCVCR